MSLQSLIRVSFALLFPPDVAVFSFSAPKKQETVTRQQIFLIFNQHAVVIFVLSVICLKKLQVPCGFICSRVFPCLSYPQQCDPTQGPQPGKVVVHFHVKLICSAAV